MVGSPSWCRQSFVQLFGAALGFLGFGLAAKGTRRSCLAKMASG
jgi:hypothetical protein